MDPRARWNELVGGPEAAIPLDEAALLISAVLSPGLDVAAALAEIDDLAARVAEPTSTALRRLLFDELGFTGDTEAYDDPVNSYLDRVVRRRRGIPITLSVLLVEVGRRCGVPLQPIGMPGHFLVRDPSGPGHLIDAFHGGRLLDGDDCQRLLRAVAGPGARPTPAMLPRVGPLAVLARMLANLDHCFARRGATAPLRLVTELRAVLPGAATGDRVQLAARLADLGGWDRAASVLEAVAADADAGPVRDRMLAEATGLRARLN